MAAWLPVIKASLPYVTQVITAAIPAFTSKSASAQPNELFPKQIAELQSAATRNAESVKALATQLKGTIEGIDSAANKLQQELKDLRRLVMISLFVGAGGLSAALWTIFSRFAG